MAKEDVHKKQREGNFQEAFNGCLQLRKDCSIRPYDPGIQAAGPFDQINYNEETFKWRGWCRKPGGMDLEGDDDFREVHQGKSKAN